MDFVTASAIVALALTAVSMVAVVITTVRMPGERAGHALLAAFGLATVTIIGRFALSFDLPHWAEQVAQRSSYVGFSLFPLAMYEFSREFGHRRAVRDRVVRALGVGLAIISVTWPSFTPLGGDPAPHELALDVLGAAYWFVVLVVVTRRLLRDASEFGSTLIRSRIHMLALGTGVAATVLIPAILERGDAGVTMGRLLGCTSLVVLAIAFAPPRVLRRGWRTRTVERGQAALIGIAGIESPNELCTRILPVIADLVGATGIELYRNGSKLASYTTLDTPVELRAALRNIRVPLLDAKLVVHATAHAPLFGEDELASAREFATILLLGVERCERREREQVEVERIVAADAVKDTFLACVSHDVRSPLTAIHGFATLLAGPAASRLDDAMRERVSDQVVASAQHVEDILDSLLDLTRIGEGRVELDLADVDLLALVHRVVAHATIRSSSVMVSGAPTIARLDRGKVERVIENLLHNADRHTPPGSTIEVIVDSSEPDEVVVHVDDDGHGVDAKARERLFEIFERDPDRAGAGTGIGLSIVARFTDMHDGSVSVGDSTRGGARFSVRLPIAGPDRDRPDRQGSARGAVGSVDR